MAKITLAPKFIRQEDGTLYPIEKYVAKHHALLLGQKNLMNYEVSSKGASSPTSSDKSLLDELYANRIEISDYADTQDIGVKGNSTILKTSMGMNIIVTKGKISALRYRVHLFNPEDPAVIINAIDGFPKDSFKNISGVKVSIKLALDKAFKFIPYIGNIVGNIADISVGPWEFTIGDMKKLQIDFSEPGQNPEWFFQGDGIKNQLNVEMSMEKPKQCEKIDAKVTAIWDLSTAMGLIHNISDNEKTIHLWPRET